MPSPITRVYSAHVQVLPTSRSPCGSYPAITLKFRFYHVFRTGKRQHASDQQFLQDVPSLWFPLTGVPTAATTLSTARRTSGRLRRPSAFFQACFSFHCFLRRVRCLFGRSVNSVSFPLFLACPAILLSFFRQRPVPPSPMSSPAFPCVFLLGQACATFFTGGPHSKFGKLSPRQFLLDETLFIPFIKVVTQQIWSAWCNFVCSNHQTHAEDRLIQKLRIS